MNIVKVKVLEKLKESYPIEVKLRNDLKNVLLITIIPPLILLLFQPFGIFMDFDFWSLGLWLAVFGFGIISGTLTLVFWILLPSFYRSYFENFKLWRAILFLLLFLIFLSSTNYFYIKLLNGSHIFSWKDYFIVLTRFVVIGLFTSIVVIMINQTRRLKSNLRLAEEINSRLQREKTTEQMVETERGKEVIRLSEETFLFAQSTDNYCTVHFLHNGLPQKKLYRLSLKSLEFQTFKMEKIVRCHRSYVVNTQMVLLTEGNSRGLELTLKYVDHTVPVSRRYIQEISKKV